MKYSLADLHSFIAVAQTNSFHQAAQRLNTSAASVSRKVSNLEEALDVRLFHRTTRKVRLTEAGKQYYGNVQNVLDALQEADEQLKNNQNELSGQLKIAAPMSFGIEVLSPLLAEFMEQHPALQIDLKLEDHQTDLLSSGIDLALRIGELTDSSLIATKICDLEFGFYGSPDYLKKHGEPNCPEELLQHECLHYNLVSRSYEWRLKDAHSLPKGRLSANNGEALREAAIKGLGLVSLPRFIVEKSLQKQLLKPILEDHSPQTIELYAIRLSRKFTPKRIKTLIDFLKEKLAKP